MSAVEKLPPFGVMANQLRDHVYLLEEGFIFTSAWVWTGETSRFPAVLLLTIDNRPFVLGAGGEQTESCCAAIAPQVLRSLDARKCLLVSVHVEPGHSAYAAFRAIGGSGVQRLCRERFASLDESLRDCHRGALGIDAARRLFEDLLACTMPELPSKHAISDTRLQEAMMSLRSHPDQSLADLAVMLKLSYDHMSHLFSKEVGLPLKSYQLWRKVKRATMLFNSGLSLTQIAHEVGFTDSAHLTRTFSHFFGIKPSYLTNSDCVQVVF